MKKSENNKSIILIIVPALVMLIAIASFTYAYFTADVTATDNLIIRATISDAYSPVFTAYPAGNLNLLVTTADMLDTDASSDNTTIADSAIQTLNVSLLAGGGSDNETFTCTYNLKWTNTGTAYVPSANATSLGLKEYTISIVDEANNNVLAETPINNLTSDSIIASGLSITSSGTLVKKVYTVKATIYNLSVSQDIYNKNYSSMVSVTDVTC